MAHRMKGQLKRLPIRRNVEESIYLTALHLLRIDDESDVKISKSNQTRVRYEVAMYVGRSPLRYCSILKHTMGTQPSLYLGRSHPSNQSFASSAIQPSAHQTGITEHFRWILAIGTQIGSTWTVSARRCHNTNALLGLPTLALQCKSKG